MLHSLIFATVQAWGQIFFLFCFVFEDLKQGFQGFESLEREQKHTRDKLANVCLLRFQVLVSFSMEV